MSLSRLPLSRSLRFGLAFAAFCAFSAVFTGPASAQDLTYKLFGVTFSDGAVAFGSFVYNPTTNVFGTFSLTTTDGVTDSSLGSSYTQISSETAGADANTFVFVNNASPYNSLDLFLPLTVHASISGLYTLLTGTVSSPTEIDGSGEFTPTARGLSTGSLYVTNAVPEASAAVSFALLLCLGSAGIAVAVKRERRAAPLSIGG